MGRKPTGYRAATRSGAGKLAKKELIGCDDNYLRRALSVLTWVCQEIRDTGGEKGFGFFVLRDFAANETILAERPAFIFPSESFKPPEQLVGDTLEDTRTKPGTKAAHPMC